MTAVVRADEEPNDPQTAHLRRKNLQTRRVKLTDGNLVIPCAIPTRLLGFLPRKDGDEFTQTRYTGVTCGPDEFNKRHYSLRPSLYDRQTELFVVITMCVVPFVSSCRRDYAADVPSFGCGGTLRSQVQRERGAVLPHAARSHEYVPFSDSSMCPSDRLCPAENISQLCKRKKSATWGPDGWKSAFTCASCDRTSR